jgi:hypothetical protein
VFRIAGVWGVLVVTPLYFLYDLTARLAPPAITHPEFHYGFAGAALVWQFVYLTIGADPIRFRPMILLAVMAKLSYFIPVVILFVQARLSALTFWISSADGVFAILFLLAFLKTRALKI